MTATETPTESPAEAQNNAIAIPSEDRSRLIVTVQGPTASGKSRLAIDLAKAMHGAIINADSLQIYSGLQVITDRPTDRQMQGVPHYLFGTVSPEDQGSVGSWLEAAVGAITEVRAKGLIPIITGGTGMYVRALQKGLAPVPTIPDDIRAAAQADLDRLGGEAFRKDLALLDPEAAERLPAGDSQRLLRAYEVARATGKTLKAWQAEHKPEPPADGRFATIALAPPRTVIYAAIERRFDQMIAQGALDEVQALINLGLDRDLTAMKAVGVRELAAHLDGDMDLQTAIESAKRSTRNYAKRQLTWLRTQTDADTKVFVEQYSESLRAKIFSFIRQFLLTDRP